MAELEASEGYEIDNPGPQYVVLPSNGNNTTTVTFADSPEITGEGGYLTDVPWKYMPIGSYTAKEVTPPEGHTKSPETSKVKQFFCWAGKTDIALVFENDANGHLSSNGLYATDDKGEIRIFGVTGTIVATEVKAAPVYVIDQSTQTQTVSGLVPGSTVVVVETKAPSGYVLNTTPQTIIVRNGSNSVTSGTGGSSDGGNTGNNSGTGGGNDLTFENAPKTTLVIEKYVTGTTNPLKAVTFLVTESNGQVVGSSNGEYITDENGRIVIEGLEPGVTVTAKEIKKLYAHR